MEDLKSRATAAMDAINSVSDEFNEIIAEYNEMLAPITLTWWPEGRTLESLHPFCLDGELVVGWAPMHRKWQLVTYTVHLLTEGALGLPDHIKRLAESSRYIRNRVVIEGILDAVAREVVKHAEKIAEETMKAAEAVRELRDETWAVAGAGGRGRDISHRGPVPPDAGERGGCPQL